MYGFNADIWKTIRYDLARYPFLSGGLRVWVPLNYKWT